MNGVTKMTDCMPAQCELNAAAGDFRSSMNHHVFVQVKEEPIDNISSSSVAFNGTWCTEKVEEIKAEHDESQLQADQLTFPLSVCGAQSAPSSLGTIQANDIGSLFEQFLEYEKVVEQSGSETGSYALTPATSPGGAHDDAVLGRLIIVQEKLSQQVLKTDDSGVGSPSSQQQAYSAPPTPVHWHAAKNSKAAALAKRKETLAERIAHSPKFAKFKKKRLTNDPPVRMCSSGSSTPRCVSPSDIVSPEERKRREAKLLETLALPIAKLSPTKDAKAKAEACKSKRSSHETSCSSAATSTIASSSARKRKVDGHGDLLGEAARRVLRAEQGRAEVTRADDESHQLECKIKRTCAKADSPPPPPPPLPATWASAAKRSGSADNSVSSILPSGDVPCLITSHPPALASGVVKPVASLAVPCGSVGSLRTKTDVDSGEATSTSLVMESVEDPLPCEFVEIETSAEEAAPTVAAVENGVSPAIGLVSPPADKVGGITNGEVIVDTAGLVRPVKNYRKRDRVVPQAFQDRCNTSSVPSSSESDSDDGYKRKRSRTSRSQPSSRRGSPSLGVTCPSSSATKESSRRSLSRSRSGNSSPVHSQSLRSRSPSSSRSGTLATDDAESINDKLSSLSNPVPYDIEHERKLRFMHGKDTAIMQRRNIYAGRIPQETTKKDLANRFGRFGAIEKITLHFREHGDSYAFIVFEKADVAVRAIEEGNDDPQYPKLDLCFGGRRRFVGGSYVDFDQNTSYLVETEVASCPRREDPPADNDFDKLLRMALQDKTKKREATPEWT